MSVSDEEAHHRSCQFLIDDALRLLLEFLIVLLSSPRLRLLPHSTYHVRDKTTRPWDPRLVGDILEDLGGIFDQLLNHLVLLYFGEPVVNALQMCQYAEDRFFDNLPIASRSSKPRPRNHSFPPEGRGAFGFVCGGARR